MIIVTNRERLSNSLGWVFTSVVTLYLFYGVYNTFQVVTR